MNEHGFQVWRHKQSGELYAIRITEGEVTGCVGPIAQHLLDRETIPDLHWTDNPADAEWARDSEREFDLYEG